MPRLLLDDHSSNGSLSGGGWLGVGIVIGFCVGLATSMLLARFLRWRAQQGKQATPQRPHIRAAPASDVIASQLSLDTQPVKDISPEDTYYSPLSNSMVKSRKSATNYNKTSMCLSPEATAALGGHGSAILHISRPMASGPAPHTGQYSTAVTPTRPPLTQPLYCASANTNTSTTQPTPQAAPTPAADQQQPQRTPQQHQRMVSVAEAYATEDLDQEWAVVLGDLDGLLAKRGQAGLASPERAVAVKTLIRFTGSRGMQFALDEALQDVLRFRGAGR